MVNDLVDENDFFQNTLKEKASISGIGLFSGEKVKITIHPAKEDHGIVFRKINQGKSTFIPANLKFVEPADRTTSIGFGKNKIKTVEHLLSALIVNKIDNALIEVYGSEIPIIDGSSKPFIELINETGIEKQIKVATVLELTEPVYMIEDYIYLVALPSEEYKINFTIHHPTNGVLKSQYFSFLVEKDTYIKEIAPARTYSIYEEIEPLLNNNMIKGGSLDNAVVIKDGKVLNSMRFGNEMVRHKILDLIGDLGLIGNRLLAHIIAIRSGHFANVKFAKQLINKLRKKNIYEYASINKS